MRGLGAKFVTLHSGNGKVKPKLMGRTGHSMAHVNNAIKASGNAVKVAGVTQPVEFGTSNSFEDYEKTAATFAMNPNMSTAFWTAVGTLGAAGAMGGIGMGIDAARGMMDRGKYEASLREAIHLSPTLQMHGYERLKPYLGIIAKSSPTVAREPRLLANYLESLLDAEGHMNLSTFSELSAIENKVLDNRRLNNSTRDMIMGAATKGLLEGTGQGIAKIMTNSMDPNLKH